MTKNRLMLIQARAGKGWEVSTHYRYVGVDVPNGEWQLLSEVVVFAPKNLIARIARVADRDDYTIRIH